jgi:hypothetical protein
MRMTDAKKGRDTMDLIDRAALKKEWHEAYEGEKCKHDSVMLGCTHILCDAYIACQTIEQQPTIEAVPMEPLCKLLHDIAYTPCYTTPGLEMCGALCGECDTTCGDEECWMRFLKKWMEGLDDHR